VGAGKSEIGRLVEGALRERGHPVALLDEADLDRHLARGPADGGLASLVWLVQLLCVNGVDVIVTVDTPRRTDRDRLRSALAGFAEVFVDAPPEVCAARGAPNDAAYEAPIAPELRIPTGDRDARASAAQLLSYLDPAL
jgi:adenylylsulfate kinase